MSTTQEQKPTVICVFCGSCPGNSPAHLAAARALAYELHKENITLVYGGGTRGIMGEIARTLVSLSGPESVHGIIPTALVGIEDDGKETKVPSNSSKHKAESKDSEGGKTAERIVSRGNGADAIQNKEYGLMTLVPDMHTRKRVMAKEVVEGGPGSGFVVLPGGFGTLEEAMEMTTWNQLGIHSRGIVLLNTEGYWDGLLSWVEKSVQDGFVSLVNSKIVVECKEPTEVVEALRKYRISDDRYVLDWESAKRTM